MLLLAACGGTSAPPVAVIATSTPDTSTPSTTNPGATPDATGTPAPTATSAPATSAPTPTPTTVPVAPLTPTPTPNTKPISTPTPPPPPTPTLSHPGGNTVTVWIQVTDSCQQALSGATFTVSGPGVNTTTGLTNGGNPTNVGSGGGCPTPHGNCGINAGCTTATLDVPSGGPNTYKITVLKTANGFGTNASYAVCEGGSICRGPEVATVIVSSSGSVSATTLNIYPDGTPVTYGPFSAAQGDPILFHEFGIAANTNIQCDGDGDKDDFLTGTPGQHCDNDNDRSSAHPGHP